MIHNVLWSVWSVYEHLYAPLFAVLVAVAVHWEVRSHATVLGMAQSHLVAGLSRAADIIAVLLCAAFAVSIAVYLMSPIYIDHIEPLVAATAWLSVHGQPMHPLWDQRQGLYGMLYGPAGFQITSLFVSVWPTIAGSKLPALAASVVAVLVEYVVVKRTVVGVGLSLRLVSIVVIVASTNFMLLTNRADPFLFVLPPLGIYCLVTLPGRSAAVAIGLAAGLATNMKVHGFLYLVPVAAALVFNQQGRWRRAECVAIGCSGAAVGILIPNLMPGASLADYGAYLMLAAHHGLDSSLLLKNVGLFCALAIMPGLAYYLVRPRLAVTDMALLLSLIACGALVAVIASKPGSGIHHLFPLIPLTVYALARILAAEPRAPNVVASAVVGILLSCLVVTFGVASLLSSEQDVKMSFSGISSANRKIEELRQLSNKYPQLEMGLTDDLNYPETYFFPVMIFQGQKLHFNAAAWMDLKQAGVAETYAMDLLINCRVPAWVLPANGAPFSMKNWYTGLPLLSGRFRELFVHNYSLIEAGQNYNVWRCRKPT